MRILFIDNYDSFTYNVIELLRRFNDVQVEIVKNDDLQQVRIDAFDKMIISPGPDLPNAAGSLMSFLQQYITRLPCLGICLGHQAIAEYFGGKLTQYENPKHGEQCEIEVLQQGLLFKNLPKQFKVGLYHSWYLNEKDCPASLKPTAMHHPDIIMAMQHEHLPIYGVQFHPESYMSEYGLEILHNFIYS